MAILPRTSIFPIRSVPVSDPLPPCCTRISLPLLSKGISTCPTTVISSNPRKLGGESHCENEIENSNSLSKIIHKISRRDYGLGEYNSMEFKNVENVGEGMLLDRERKKLRNIPAFFLLFFSCCKYSWNSLLPPSRLFFLINYSTFMESLIEFNEILLDRPIFIKNKDISKVDVWIV